jgi:hypothetical protein
VVEIPWYGLTVSRQWGATTTNWVGGTQQCSLHTATYTPNQDTDDFFNDATNEVTGTNYVANGVTLGSKTNTYDTATDEIRLDAADAQWVNATIASIRYAVVWENTAGANTTDPLLTYYDLGAQSVTAATFSVQWDSTGVAKFDVT